MTATATETPKPDTSTRLESDNSCPTVRPFKRFLLMAWIQDHPAGGFSDFINDYDTLLDALRAFQWDEHKWTVCEIVDLENRSSMFRLDRDGVVRQLERMRNGNHG